MPKYEKEEGEKRTQKELIGAMEQFFSQLLYLKKNERVALEIASETGGSDISFYVAIPSRFENFFEKFVHSAYPLAIVEKISKDYTIFEPTGISLGSFLKLKGSFYFPINTYKNLDVDPLEGILNSLAKIKKDEGAAFQIILQKSQLNLKEKGLKVIEEIKKGQKPSFAIRKIERTFIEKILLEILEMTFFPKKKEESQKISETPKIDEVSLKAIEAKIQKPVFVCNLRLIAVAQDLKRADEILTSLESAFSQFESIFNGFNFIRQKGKRLKELVFDFSFRNFKKSQSTILNIEELSTIYHFPISTLKAPAVKWVRTKEVPFPSELPEKGLILIGKAIYRGMEKDIYFATVDDRRRHVYIVGQTGTGKTSLLREMIRRDIESGNGVGVIDPHGDLIEATLANIPKERADDVILFEPFDRERPPGLNMLEWETPEQRDFAVAEMITIFSYLFPPEIIGPMFEHWMRNGFLALMADKEKPGTLVEIPKIFTDENFARKKLEKVEDVLVRTFWEKEYPQLVGEARGEMLGYVISKVGRFVENEMMRNIIGQRRTTFNISEIMDKKKIFLANLSKGQLGELNSQLLGMILVSKFQVEAMKRAKIPEEKRVDFYLYIDEFQNFTTPSIATILSEARKYRLNLIIAHQYIPQLKEEIKNAVLGNVGTMIVFRIGPLDAEFLEKQFAPEFSKYDLMNLDNFNFICKMMIENKISSPFKGKTLPPKKGNEEIVPLIKELSKMKFTRKREVVEEEIKESFL
ncbi:MAG: type IV secretion system DNA-binding domain-containing protein [Candidatus Pacearchaeota archaeon]